MANTDSFYLFIFLSSIPLLVVVAFTGIVILKFFNGEIAIRGILADKETGAGFSWGRTLMLATTIYVSGYLLKNVVDNHEFDLDSALAEAESILLYLGLGPGAYFASRTSLSHQLINRIFNQNNRSPDKQDQGGT